jgi:hypothetical protein
LRWLFLAVVLAPRAGAAAPAPPAVSITAPDAEAVLSGTVVLSARASSPGGIAAVQFRLDGADLGARLTSPPYSFSWNTSQAAGDTHLLTAVAWDRAGRSAASAGLPIAVDNTPLRAADVSASVLGSDAATVGWTTSRPADAQVEYGPSPAYGSSTVLDAAPKTVHAASLNGLTAGTLYHYRVKSKDAAGNAVESADFSFATPAPAADVTPPTIVLMNPAAGALVSSAVAVSANASDNVGVAAVQFILDGAELGPPVTASPYLFSWSTTLVPDGQHILGALARDAAGNSATAVVAVTVSNAPPVIGPPAIGAASANRADVLWTTDQRSDSAADYGPTPAYGASTPVISAQSTGHGVTLTGLAPGTLYHYRVRSRSVSGVLSVSGDFAFTTPGTSAGTVPAASAPGAAAAGVSAAKAPQKFLTPATADGINDEAVFGPAAREVWIFDVRGRQVFHQSSAAPAAPVVWDGRDGSGRVVPSGVYVAKIRTSDSSLVYQSFTVAK